MIDLIIAFVCGAVLEALYAYGVIVIAERRAIRSGILSMVWMLLMRVGIGEALQGWLPTVVLGFGYGVGCWAVVKWSPRTNHAYPVDTQDSEVANKWTQPPRS